MVQLLNQKQFRPVMKLPFCYLCCETFVDDDEVTRDHVPADSTFSIEQKEPLLLPTHRHCNKKHELADEKMAQIIGARRGYAPSDPKHRRLNIVRVEGELAAVTNINIESAVWRWVRGFHAALYGQPLKFPFQGEVTTPFVSAELTNDGAKLDMPSANYAHLEHVLRTNRSAENVDRIISNKGALTYESVWGQSEQSGPWLCAFTLNIADWKDLGEPRLGQRDCIGFYVSRDLPVNASVDVAHPATKASKT